VDICHSFTTYSTQNTHLFSAAQPGWADTRTISHSEFSHDPRN